MEISKHYKLGLPRPTVNCYNWPATTVSDLLRHRPYSKTICGNGGPFDTERKICLLLREAHRYNLRLCLDCGILGSTVNYCRLLSLQALNEHYPFVSSAKNMNVFVSLLFGFQGGVLVKITEACPPLNCSEKDHILPENQCCSVCRGKWACCCLCLGWGWQGLFWCEGLMKRVMIIAWVPNYTVLLRNSQTLFTFPSPALLSCKMGIMIASTP